MVTLPKTMTAFLSERLWVSNRRIRRWPVCWKIIHQGSEWSLRSVLCNVGFRSFFAIRVFLDLSDTDENNPHYSVSYSSCGKYWMSELSSCNHAKSETRFLKSVPAAFTLVLLQPYLEVPIKLLFVHCKFGGKDTA